MGADPPPGSVPPADGPALWADGSSSGYALVSPIFMVKSDMFSAQNAQTELIKLRRRIVFLVSAQPVTTKQRRYPCPVPESLHTHSAMKIQKCGHRIKIANYQNHQSRENIAPDEKTKNN